MDTHPREESLRFARGFVFDRNLIYVVGFLRDLDELAADHAVILRYLDGEWGQWSVDDPIVAIAAADGPLGRTVFALGIDGQVQVGDVNGFRWEAVSTDGEAPNRLRHMCDMRPIGSILVAAGMARQVYTRRIRAGGWTRIDRGVLVPRSSPEIAGFRAIDGTCETDIYAVGFYGQIWHYDGNVWFEESSPTNIRLESVRAVSPDRVFIGGNAGLLLRGYHQHWNVLTNTATKRTIRSIESFQGDIYAATEGGIYRVNDGDVVPIEIAMNRAVSTYMLHANDEVLLSVGPRDLYLFDGSTWRELPHPQLD